MLRVAPLFLFLLACNSSGSPSAADASTDGSAGPVECAHAAGDATLLEMGREGAGALGIAVSGDEVLWVDREEGSLWRAAAQTEPTVVETGMYQPNDVAIDGDDAYWTVFDRVMHLDLTTGETKEVAGGQDGASGIALDETWVYWVNYNGSAVMKAPRAGGNAVTLTTAVDSPTDVAVLDGFVYWNNFGQSIERISVEGGEPETLATGQPGASSVAVNEHGVYWANRGSVETAGAVWWQPHGADDPERLADESDTPSVIAVVGRRVLWGNMSGSVRSTTAGNEDCEIVTIASGEPQIHGIAADDRRVLWTNLNDGSVRQAKIEIGAGPN